MIRLYDANETQFDHEETILTTLSCTVSEDENGAFLLNMETPIDERIQAGKIVKASTPRGDQLFRIKSVKKKLDRHKQFHEISGEHIFYDLRDNLILNIRPTNMIANNALKAILDGTEHNHRFTSWSDVEGSNTANYVRMNPIQAIMGSQDNALLNLWGGYLKRDNFDIKVHRAPLDRGYEVRLGKNLMGVEQSIDASQIVTRIYPTVVIEGNIVTDLPEKYVDSPLINYYPAPLIRELRIDLTDEEKLLPIEEVYQLMRDRAEAHFDADADKPMVNYKINFVQLGKTEQYKDLAILEALDISDVVHVAAEDIGINLDARVIKYTWDALHKRFLEIELGNFKPKLTNQNQKVIELIEKVSEEVTDGKIVTALKDAIERITGHRGGYRYDLFNPDGLPSGTIYMDEPDINTAQHYIVINNQGIAFGDSGLSKPPTIAINIDGTIAGDGAFFNSVVTHLIQSDIGKSLDLSSNTSINSNVTELVKQYIALPEVAEMFKDEEKKTYIAYSNSPDGVQDFVPMPWSENLLLNSGVSVTNSAYPTQTYTMSQRMVAGQTYTIQIWGLLGEGKLYFRPYLNTGREIDAFAPIRKVSDGHYVGTFQGKEGVGYTEDKLLIYAIPDTLVVNSTIDKIKLELGATATPWQPHSSEVQDRHYVGLYQGLDPDDYRGEGENLWLDSYGLRYRSNNSAVYPVQDEDYGGHRRIRRDPDFDTFPSPGFSVYPLPMYTTTVGETYTESIEVKPEIDLMLGYDRQNTTLCKAGEWTRISKIKTADKTPDHFMFLDTTYKMSASNNPWIEYRRPKVELGVNPNPVWTPAPADILADINNPSNYKWIPLVPSTVTDQFSTIQDALDYMQEIQTQLSTAIQQTSEDISLVASSTGGGNYILNSVGYGGTKYWEATGDVQTWADSWVMEQQARSGFRMGTATLSQEVSLDPTKEYTFTLKAQSGGGVNASIKVNDTVLASVVTTESKTINIMHQITGERQVRISIETNAYAGTYLMLTDIGIFLGHGVEGWSQAPTEHYSNTVRIDLDGVVIDEGIGETLEIKSTGMLHRYQGETVLHHSRAGTMLRSLVVPPIQFVDRDTHLGITYVGRIK